MQSIVLSKREPNRKELKFGDVVRNAAFGVVRFGA
jgi:hypothetical protein